MRKDEFKNLINDVSKLKENVPYLKTKPNLNNTLDKVFTTFIFDFLKNLKLEEKFLQLIKPTIAGRICYSKNSIEEMLENDERINDLKTLIEYLSKLEKMRHYSVFRHFIVQITKRDFEKYIQRYLKEENNKPILRDIVLFRYTNENINKLLYNFGYTLEDLNTLYNRVPTIPITEKELKFVDYLFELFKSFIEKTYYVPYVGKDTIVLNFQHVLELYNEVFRNDKNVQKEKSTIFEEILDLDVNNSLVEQSYKEFIEVYKELLKSKNKREIVYNKDLNQKVNVWILDHNFEDFEDIRDLYITFIVEGLNRNFTHQLVRHTLFSAYSQRSLRYVNEGKTKIETIEEKFLVPNLDYIKNEVKKDVEKDVENKRGRKPLSLKQKVYKQFLDVYSLTFDTYKELIEKYNVKKEDARDILSCGIRTTIITTFFGRGLENFLIERLSPKAQSHIRLVANVIIDLL